VSPPQSSQLVELEHLDLATIRGETVLVRVDFNVPLEGGRVMDDTRLLAALPTVRVLGDAGARVVLMSHCGRPQGLFDLRFSLKPAAERLAELLKSPVAFARNCVGEEAQNCIVAMRDGDIAVLENLRFHPGEKKNDDAFSDRLAQLGSVYVNDAFGAAHRAHASIVGLPSRISRKALGRLMVRELQSLNVLLEAPTRPFAAVVGGAKIEGKVDTLKNLLPRLDILILGGGMANTFLAAEGHEMQNSLVERDRLELATEILMEAAARNVRVILPSDLVVTDSLELSSRVETVEANQVPEGMMAVDIGAESCREMSASLASAKTVFWNGPMGVFEKAPFDRGTMSVAEAVGSSSGFSVIGGGETVAAARRAGALDGIGHVSTGGGATLELLAGKVLPGIQAFQGQGS
jgi:phosphoglycerate kinase